MSHSSGRDAERVREVVSSLPVGPGMGAPGDILPALYTSVEVYVAWRVYRATRLMPVLVDPYELPWNTYRVYDLTP